MRIVLFLLFVIAVAISGATWIAYREAKRIQQAWNRATCVDCSAVWYYSHRHATRLRKLMPLLREIVLLGEWLIRLPSGFFILEAYEVPSRCPRCGSPNIRVDEPQSKS